MMMKTKTKKYWILGVFALMTINCIGQPVEQENQQYQEVIKVQAIALGSDTTSHLNSYMISSSNSKKFDNWQHGEADILIVIYDLGGAPSQQKIGTIKADGSFGFSLPEDMVPKNKVSDFFKCRYMESPPETMYSTPTSGLAHAGSMNVVQSEKKIGSLSLATSKQQAYNNSPYGQYRGESGYRLEWWYAEAETSAKVGCKRINANGKEIQSIYDLEFKPGWNLMKVEIAESYSAQFYKTKKYSVVAPLPDDVRWVFNSL